MDRHLFYINNLFCLVWLVKFLIWLIKSDLSNNNNNYFWSYLCNDSIRWLSSSTCCKSLRWKFSAKFYHLQPKHKHTYFNSYRPPVSWSIHSEGHSSLFRWCFYLPIWIQRPDFLLVWTIWIYTIKNINYSQYSWSKFSRFLDVRYKACSLWFVYNQFNWLTLIYFRLCYYNLSFRLCNYWNLSSKVHTN